MLSRTNLLRAAIAASAVLAAVALGAPRASADDARLTVAPAVDGADAGTNVQLVQWGRPYGYRYRSYYRPYGRPYYSRGWGGYYGPAYSGGYYGGYSAPYPAYGYGYAYPTYSYGYPAYGYPAYGYPVYGGIGIQTGRVGVGIW